MLGTLLTLSLAATPSLSLEEVLQKNYAARGGLDEAIGVDERPVEAIGARGADGGLARAHEADEYDIAVVSEASLVIQRRRLRCVHAAILAESTPGAGRRLPYRQTKKAAPESAAF